ncbi:hydantoinase/oxoprolinase family protein [Emcibacter sp.]|uniref:hydantoinase/oxoprolinase family protein n=1 Tax=Emcibacter sp. TaxID=1979954 RepID=UPI003A9404F7
MAKQKKIRIGIDVGGTNTDAILMDGSKVCVSIKVPTSGDIGSGVAAAARAVMEKADVKAEDIGEVMIGTTQFTNAFIERKQLVEVAVIRIALPATTSILPYTDWPVDLREVVGDNIFLVHGGNEFDGREITALREEEIVAVARQIRQRNISAVAISSLFSAIDVSMEEKAAEILRRECPDVKITLSNEIGRLGLIERENATIMNASLSSFVETVVGGFRAALEELKIDAPLFVSQNDGTLMSEDYVGRYPVLTFASGPTNSMRGAANLTAKEEAIVVDIGGTTTDIGVLTNGFPRESSIPVDIGGVRTNFRMPDILSIGLGGGSIVRQLEDGEIRIGPDSVGYRLTEEAMIFGGETLTVTDVIVAAGHAKLGDLSRVAHLDKEFVTRVEDRIHAMIETAVDRMKTSKDDTPVILVGGGSIIVSRNLKGTSELLIPENFGVANAIGAAIAQVGGEVDRIYSYSELGRDKAMEEARNEAMENCLNAGANPESLKIVDIEELPLSYLPGGAVRLRVKVVGELLETTSA